jgi:hypothetical protein
MAQRSRACNCGCQASQVMQDVSPVAGIQRPWIERGLRAGLRYQPMYWPPLADRLAPVIQAASSGMKNATA